MGDVTSSSRNLLCGGLLGMGAVILIAISYTGNNSLSASSFSPQPIPLPRTAIKPLNMTGRCFITYELANFRHGRRLGNHLFNTAAMLILAQKNNMTAILPEGARIFLDMDVMSVVTVNDGQYETFVKESKPFKEISSRIYDKKTETLPCNITLIGYYQSWRYFINYTRTVRKLISFKPMVIQNARYIFKTYQYQYFKLHKRFPEVAVGIHARMGLAENADDGYEIAPASYFQKAIQYFEKIYAHKRLSFIVSSDNMTWCRSNIKAPNVFYSEAKAGPVDMAVQSLCDDTITTLGSFTWWCAFWAGGSHVTYYKDWVRPGSHIEKHINQTDMFYANWVGIS